ncbi:Uncharacterized protein TCM_021939 [Theobroma cacao]|uniref:Uncharacterized protein n=1 Tax=Theobroma cacao TaxID=3641 RepID=A0A061EZ31_THECC|nr:Uncharacterized protein TCM_021939 [Theobroma cacao]
MYSQIQPDLWPHSSALESTKSGAPLGSQGRLDLLLIWKELLSSPPLLLAHASLFLRLTPCACFQHEYLQAPYLFSVHAIRRVQRFQLAANPIKEVKANKLFETNKHVKTGSSGTKLLK